MLTYKYQNTLYYTSNCRHKTILGIRLAGFHGTFLIQRYSLLRYRMLYVLYVVILIVRFDSIYLDIAEILLQQYLHVQQWQA